MTAVWFRFRAELGTRWRAWLGLALLVGIGAGVVIAAAAGARRTDSAYPRFLRDQRAFDVVAFPLCPGPEDLAPGEAPKECDVTTIARLPQVRDSAIVSNLSADVRTAAGRSLQPGGDPTYTGPGEVSVLGSADGRFGRAINRRHVLEGRLPHDDAPDEVALSKALAERAGVHVGDTLRARFAVSAPGEPRVRHRLRVVGIEVSPFEVEPPSGAYLAVVHVSPALLRLASAESLRVDRGLVLRLVGGDRSVEALRREITSLPTGAVIAFRQADQAKAVERAIRPHVLALALLAALAGLAVVAVFGAALARQAWVESAGYPTLWALGLRRRQLVGLTVARAAAVGLLAAPAAVLTAFLLSPLTPIGLARDAEPRPGLAVDRVALGLGLVLTLALVVALVLWPAWRIARAAGARGDAGTLGRRPSAVAAAMTVAGFPPAATVGARMALETGGRGAVPVRTGFLGVTAGVLALGAALGFSASLDHLLVTPRLVGFSWDAVAFFGDDKPADPDALTRRLEQIPGVAGATPGTFFFRAPFPDHALLLGPRRMSVFLLAIGPGVVRPSVIDGRAPVAPGEILLGTETLDELGLDIGDTVRAGGQVGESDRPDAFQETSARLRIVGTGVVPFGSGDRETAGRLGRGAVMTVPGLHRLNPVALADVRYVRFEPGAARRTVVAALRREVAAGRLAGVFAGRDPLAAEGILDIEQIDELPLLLAGIVAVVAAGVLAHVLVTSARARRRDLAVLRALGFRRRQVRSSLAWQATTIAAVALVVGLPIGIVLGRWGWRIYARSIGVVPEPAVAWLTVAVAVGGALVVANVVAAWPGRAAARTPAATVLRSE